MKIILKENERSRAKICDQKKGRLRKTNILLIGSYIFGSLKEPLLGGGGIGDGLLGGEGL